jgi:hypothetical protein
MSRSTKNYGIHAALSEFYHSKPFLVRTWRSIWAIKLRIWDFFNLYQQRGISSLNVLTTFPIYAPNSAGTYRERAPLTIQSINRTFPLLSELADRATGKLTCVQPLEAFCRTDGEREAGERLANIFRSYGSDKSTTHNYHMLYGPLLHRLGHVRAMLEIGLGTNNTDVVSNMGRAGSPGASLRAFRDFLGTADVFGADVDKRVLFTEDRIRTFFVDQLYPASFDNLQTAIPGLLDLIIDDGLHSPDANLATAMFAVKKLRPGGWLVIEDIPVDAAPVWQVVAAVLSSHFETGLFQAASSLLFVAQKSPRAVA